MKIYSKSENKIAIKLNNIAEEVKKLNRFDREKLAKKIRNIAKKFAECKDNCTFIE